MMWLTSTMVHHLEACGEPLKRICYYTSWGGVLPNPPELCTHVVYAFASMENGMLSGVWSNPLKELKQKNPDIKLMVAVGGWGFGVQRMTEMLKDESSRKKFVDDSVNFLKKFEFDGLDLDFECTINDFNKVPVVVFGIIFQAQFWCHCRELL